MAHDDLPPVLRRRRDLLGLRDGVDALDPSAGVLRARGLHHDAPSREHGKGAHRDRPDRRLRLRGRAFHGVVQREPRRAVPREEPGLRPLLAGVLDADPLQHPDRPAPLVPEDPDEAVGSLGNLARDQRRNVARALRDRRRQPHPRSPAFELAGVPRHAVGHRHLRRFDRALPVAPVPLYPVPARHFDLGDALSRRRDGGARMKRAARPPMYGLLAEFADRDRLLEAANRTREAGYRSVDAYTPLPVEGLSEAIGFRHTRLPWVVFTGGALGAIVGFGMQFYAAAVHYPQNIGGRPLNRWPAFIPITFELT